MISPHPLHLLPDAVTFSFQDVKSGLKVVHQHSKSAYVVFYHEKVLYITKFAFLVIMSFMYYNPTKKRRVAHSSIFLLLYKELISVNPRPPWATQE